MPILSIEKKILKPGMGYLNFESQIPWENFFGEELANAQFSGLIKIFMEAAAFNRNRVNIEFPDKEVERIWENAENEALGKVGRHRNFVYRLRPDEDGPIEVYLYDTALSTTLYPGMCGIMIGEIANSRVVNE